MVKESNGELATSPVDQRIKAETPLKDSNVIDIESDNERENVDKVNSDKQSEKSPKSLMHTENKVEKSSKSLKFSDDSDKKSSKQEIQDCPIDKTLNEILVRTIKKKKIEEAKTPVKYILKDFGNCNMCNSLIANEQDFYMLTSDKHNHTVHKLCLRNHIVSNNSGEVSLSRI